MLLYLFCNKSHYENVPFDIPENWVWTTIEDIAESNIGLTYKPTDICANGVPVYRSNNIQNRRICLKELVRVNTNILEKQYLQEGDLLICARNGSRNLVGKCAIVDNLNEPTSFGAFMAVCRSALNPWIFQILNSEYFNTYLDDSNSTAINQVTQKMLLAFQLPIPPAAEQERIISKLKQWYEYIDEIEDRKIELESYIKQTKSKILDLAISGKLVSQDPNDEPAIELLKRINPAFQPCDNSHYENLPKGWAVCHLEDVCQICDNQRQPINSTERQERKKRAQTLYPYYGATGQVDWIDDYMLDGTFILLGEDGAPFLEKFADKAYVVSGKIWVNNHAHILKPNCDITYLTYYLNRYDYSKCVNGSTRLKLTQADMKNMTIVLPPIVEQHRIAGRIEKIFRMLDAITAEL